MKRKVAAIDSQGRGICVEQDLPALASGQVQVEVAARLDECRFEIKISDQGPGISEDELELVFDKFVRSSRTRNGAGGTGLGLAISRELTNAHRGEILAGNVFGGGAQFTLCLPCEQKAESADDAQAA